MFCPACGVKNEPGLLQCFICKSSLPSLAGGDKASPRRAAAARPVAVAAAERLGAIGDRMLALVLDRVFLLALLAVPSAYVAQNWTRRELAAQMPSVLLSGMGGAAGLVLIVFLYHFLFEALFGTTLGKGILGLQVQDEGERGRFAMSAIRNAVRIIDSFALYALGFFVALFSSRNQRLGDHIAKSVVVEHPVHWSARLALLVVWIVAIAGSLWFAATLCPLCVPDRSIFKLPI